MWRSLLMKNITLTKESIKILRIHSSYNKKIEDDLNFCKTIKNVCNVIKLQSVKLSLKGKISIFKSLAISKVAQSVVITKVPNTVIKELNPKKFLYVNKNENQTRHFTQDYIDYDLKSVDIEHKIASLKCF